ncbi:MAG: hypothetical protein LDLANPLL_00926 [Turneriella sp.]|nr:hypothetical protein [Turneriella sp.]
MWFEQPVAEFFLETALIEVGGFIFGLALTMILYKPSGVYGAIVGLLLAAIAYWSWGDPLLDKYTQGGYAWYWWIVLAVSLLSSLWTHMISLLPEAALAVNKPLPRFLDWSDGLDSSPFESWRYLPVAIGAYPFLWFIVFLTPLGSFLAKLIFAFLGCSIAA